MISMKKILITLTVLFAVIDIMAQEHLSFKGIPIEGSMTEFCQKLKSKGFTSIGRENNITLFYTYLHFIIVLYAACSKHTIKLVEISFFQLL